MKKSFLIALILLSVVNLSALATLVYHRLECCKPVRPCAEHPQTCVGLLQKTLELTEAQQREFLRQQNVYSQQTDHLAAQLYDCRMSLSRCLLHASTDTVQLQALLCRMDSLQNLLHRRVVHHLLQQKNHLSPRQQEKFFSMILKQCTLNAKSCCPSSIEPFTKENEP
ncbi:periplasmic heavy metal sensor [bacterium]|nr:periplasmic heavy metal sensor [bacterium]